MKQYNHLILAGSKREFDNLLLSIPEIIRDEFFYAPNIHALAGREFDSITTIGTFWRRKDARQIFNYAKLREKS